MILLGCGFSVSHWGEEWVLGYRWFEELGCGRKGGREGCGMLVVRFRVDIWPWCRGKVCMLMVSLWRCERKMLNVILHVDSDSMLQLESP